MFNEAMIGMSAVYGRQIGCYVARDITTGCRAIATSPDIYTDSTLMRGAHRGNIPPPLFMLRLSDAQFLYSRSRANALLAFAVHSSSSAEKGDG